VNEDDIKALIKEYLDDELESLVQMQLDEAIQPQLDEIKNLAKENKNLISELSASLGTETKRINANENSVSDIKIDLKALQDRVKVVEDRDPCTGCDLSEVKTEIKATQQACMKLKEMVEANKVSIGKVKEETDGNIKKFGEDLSAQLKSALAKYMKVEDIEKLKTIFLTKKESIDYIEKQIADRKFLSIGNWKLIVGSSSNDFYIKDTVNDGYYRLGTTSQHIRLDAAAYHANGQAAPSFQKRPGSPDGND
jgi:chromosome segregation ATPase